MSEYVVFFFSDVVPSRSFPLPEFREIDHGKSSTVVDLKTGAGPTAMSTEFTPPYMRQGLYAVETRKLIEAANRMTVVEIFKRRKKEQEELAYQRRAYQNHLIGIHTYGFCPWCPANVFYD